MENKEKKVRKFSGVVVSTKMNKTAIVVVERTVEHPKYKKQYKMSKRYKAHDENNISKVGNQVVIEECRPISKDKKWRIIK